MTVRGYLGRFGGDIGVLEGEPGGLSVRPGVAAVNPNFLALSPDARVLYAAVRDDSGNTVGAWTIEGDTLRPLGEQRLTGGEGFCHLSVDPTGRFVLAAHFGSGNLSVHPVADDGSVEERSDFVQHPGDEPHIHMVIGDPTGEFILAVDLGLDTIFRYRLVDGRLEAAGSVQMPEGVGPWHVAFHPSLPYAYVTHQLGSSLAVLDLNTFEVVGPLLALAQESMPGAIHVSMDGRFCYVADQKHNRIEILQVADDGRSLTPIDSVSCGGELPRHFVLSGDHVYVANRDSSSVTQFVRDTSSGGLTPTGTPLSTPEPMCVLML